MPANSGGAERAINLARIVEGKGLGRTAKGALIGRPTEILFCQVGLQEFTNATRYGC